MRIQKKRLRQIIKEEIEKDLVREKAQLNEVAKELLGKMSQTELLSELIKLISDENITEMLNKILSTTPKEQLLENLQIILNSKENK